MIIIIVNNTRQIYYIIIYKIEQQIIFPIYYCTLLHHQYLYLITLLSFVVSILLSSSSSFKKKMMQNKWLLWSTQIKNKQYDFFITKIWPRITKKRQANWTNGVESVLLIIISKCVFRRHTDCRYLSIVITPLAMHRFIGSPPS